MRVRAKFTVSKVSEFGNGNGSRQEITVAQQKPTGGTEYVSTGVPYREIKMVAQYDPSKSAEDISFAEATPNGEIMFSLNNPILKDEFKPGDVYYVEFIKKEKTE